MKNLIKHLIVTVSMLFTGTALIAQTKYLRHVELTKYHTKVKIHASNSIGEKSSDRDMHKLNAEEAGKNLRNAIDHHSELKKMMLARYGSILKPHHEAIDKYHNEAMRHYEGMRAEANKFTCSTEKIRKYAKDIYLAIEKAELEHQALKYKTS